MLGYLRNFQNPFGLATRMLKTGNPAAYWAMGRMAGTPLVTPLDVALTLRERKLLADAGEITQPILLVVGPPRSGTSWIMEQFTNRFDVVPMREHAAAVTATKTISIPAPVRRSAARAI